MRLLHDITLPPRIQYGTVAQHPGIYGVVWFDGFKNFFSYSNLQLHGYQLHIIFGLTSKTGAGK